LLGAGGTFENIAYPCGSRLYVQGKQAYIFGQIDLTEGNANWEEGQYMLITREQYGTLRVTRSASPSS
jgi:hypothetical protein